MKRKKLTKTFMMILNWKKPFGFLVYANMFQPLRVKCRKTDKYSVPNKKQWAIPLSTEITAPRIVKAAS